MIIYPGMLTPIELAAWIKIQSEITVLLQGYSSRTEMLKKERKNETGQGD